MPYTIYDGAYFTICRGSGVQTKVQTLHDTIVGVLTDPYFSIPSEEASVCLKAARDMGYGTLL